MEHTVVIEKIIHGGAGLAHLDDGMVVMVPLVLPGEKVVIREIKRSRKFVKAEPVTVLTQSPERLTPPCPYYGHCGGCDLQHMTYGAQLEAKASLLLESLSRAKLDLEGAKIDAALPSPARFNYRHRIRLHLDVDGNLGFHRALSRQVIAVQRCLLATEEINDRLHLLQARDLAKQAKNWKALELIHSPADGKVSLVLHPRRPHSVAAPPDFFREAADYLVVKSPRAYHDGKAAADSSVLNQKFSIGENEYCLGWDSHCFFQVNAGMNDNLVRFVCDQVKAKAAGPLLDLFCGIGNFSIPLALLGWSVTGVEHNRRSISLAEKNTPAAVPITPRFLCSDVTKALLGFNTAGRQFQVILLDPPRQGLGKEAAGLAASLDAEKIVYISCDPATLARDLAVISTYGYHIKRVTPVDMFPQTHHVESVVVLEKN